MQIHRGSYALWLKLASVVPILILSGCPADRAYWDDGRLPNRVREVSLDSQKQGIGLHEVHRRIRFAYGEPIYDAGQERWSIDGGVLTFDPVAGLFFVTKQSEMIRVIRNKNPLRESILGRYSMCMSPDSERPDLAWWVGTLRLRTNNTYDYEYGGHLRKQDFDQNRNFFMLHPTGTFEMIYLNGFKPTTLCESIHGHNRVAELRFRSHDGTEKTYFIAHKMFWNKIAFESDEQQEFKMEKWWDMH
jgi:hypothetical protein